MKVGYIRISMQEQNEILQADALRDAGCEKFFADPMTGSKFERKGLEQALIYLRSGDILIAWKLPTSSVSHCYAQYTAGARDRLYFAEYAYMAIRQQMWAKRIGMEVIEWTAYLLLTISVVSAKWSAMVAC